MSVSWYCIVCHSHNHSTILVDLIDSAESNTFSVFSPTVSIDASNSSLSDASFGEPKASSSPRPPTKHPKHHRANTRQNLRILVVNFKGVKNKRNDLQVMIESTKHDVILGTETWLSNKICTAEVFAPEVGGMILYAETGKGTCMEEFSLQLKQTQSD